MLNKRFLAGAVARIHAADLRNGNVGFVDDRKKIGFTVLVGKIVQKRVRWFSGFPAIEMARVVLDTAAKSKFADHRNVLPCAPLQTLGLQNFARVVQILQSRLQLLFDVGKRDILYLFWGHVLPRRKYEDCIMFLLDLARDGVDFLDLCDLTARKIETINNALARGHELDTAPERAKGSGRKIAGRALKIYGDEFARERCTRHRFTFRKFEVHLLIFDGTSKSVDTRDRSDDDDIFAREKRLRGGMSQTLDIFIDICLFLDVGVGNGYVCFWLIKIVVGNEVVYGILGEKIPIFGGKLRRKRLVVRDDKRRFLPFLDNVG